MLDWDKLRIFHQVTKAGSFTAAAEVMNLSQPALSRQVIALEKQLSMPVFKRSRQGLKLTKEGAVLFEQTEKMFSHAEFAQRFIKDQGLEPEGSINILTTHTITSWLMRYLPNFLEKYPNIRFHFESDNRLSMNNSAIDVTIAPYQIYRTDLVQIPIHTFTMGLFANQEYLEKNGTPKTVDDLDKHKLLVINPTTSALTASDWILNIGRENTPRTPYLTGVASSHMLLKAAQAGLGIVQFAVGYPESEGVELVQVLPELKAPSMDVYYSYSKDKARYKSIRLFGKYLSTIDLSKSP